MTEATLESGSLITARLAADQGREVFAVPGSIRDDTSRGPHKLLRDGAKLVERAEDIILELWPQLEESARQRLTARAAAGGTEPAPRTQTLNSEEAEILGALGVDPLHIDVLAERTHLPASSLAATLLTLELRGLVRQLPGQLYLRL